MGSPLPLPHRQMTRPAQSGDSRRWFAPGVMSHRLPGALLIGCSEIAAAGLRQQLHRLSIVVEQEYANWASLSDDEMPSGDVPRLVLVEVAEPADYDGIRQLALHYPSWPLVAIVALPAEDGAVLKAMRAGAGQVVPLPIDPPELNQAIQSLLERQLGTGTGAESTIAVCGVTGGCGATTLAVNLAYEISCGEEFGCLLVDMSLQLGNLTAHLDIQPRHTTQDLLAAIDHLDEWLMEQAVARFGNNLRVIAGPYRTLDPGNVSPAAVRRLLEVVSRLSRTLVLDIPGTYDHLFFETLSTATDILLVGEQEFPAIGRLRLLDQILEREVPSVRRTVVINRYDPRLRDFDVPRLQKMLGRDEIHTIANDHKAVTAAINSGRPLRLRAPESRIVSDIAALVDNLLDREPALRNTSESMYRRLTQAFRVARGKGLDPIELRRLEQAILVQRVRRDEILLELKKRQDELEMLDHTIEARKADIELLAQEPARLQETAHVLEQEIRANEKRRAERESELARLQADLTQSHQRRNEVERTIECRKAEQSELERAIDDAHAKNFRTADLIKARWSELAQLEDHIANRRQQLDRLEAELARRSPGMLARWFGGGGVKRSRRNGPQPLGPLAAAAPAPDGCRD